MFMFSFFTETKDPTLETLYTALITV